MYLLTMIWIISIMFVCSFCANFDPLTPKLRADVGLLSVNIPPGQLREKYWLHNIIVDLPCIDEVVTPSIPVIVSEMNMSASAIMHSIDSVNLTTAHEGTEYRVQGSLKALRITFNLFHKLIKTVRKKYNRVNSGPATLWGILNKKRCSNNNNNDVLVNTKGTIGRERYRVRRDTSRRSNPDGANTFNLAGTGHTLNYHQETPDDTPTTLNLYHRLTNRTISGLNTLDREVEVDGRQLPEGRIASEKIVQDAMAYDQQCEITLDDRLAYITCVLKQPEKESLCYKSKLKCNKSGSLPRGKRGAFDFLGDIQNKLYGVATDAQLKAVHYLLNDMHNESIRNSQEIQLIRNETMTLNNYLVKGLTHLSRHLYDEISNLSHSVQVWANNVDDNLHSVNVDMQEINQVSMIHTATLTINVYSHILHSMVSALDAVTNHYQDTMASISQHTISPRFFSDDLLSQLWKTISTNSMSHLQIADSDTELSLLISSIFSTYTTRSKLIIVLRIPLVLHSQDITFWDPRSVPIIKDQYSYEVVMQDNILIIDEANKAWAVIDYTDYIICIKGLNRICEVDMIWTSWDSPCCHLSVHLTKYRSHDICQVRKTNHNEGDIPFIVSSGARSWLISTNRDKMEAQLTCAGYQGVPSHNSVQKLPLLGIVSLPLFCEMAIGNHKIHSPYSQIGSTEMLIVSSIEEVHHEYQDFIVVNLTKEVPFLSYQHHNKPAQPTLTENTLFNKDVTSIKELNDKLKKGKSVYFDDISRLQSKFEKDEVTYYDTFSSLSHYITTFHLWDFLIPLPSVFNVIIIAWLSWLTFRGTGVPHTPIGAALTLMSLSHQGFAYPTGNINTTSTASTISHCESIHVWLSWVPVVCLVGMILLHVHIISLLYLYYTELSIRLGWTSVNRLQIHHSGENRLHIGILLNFHSLLGGLVTCREIVVQVATLPSKQDDWYLSSESRNLSKAISGSFYRSSKEIRIKIDWKMICLRSRLFTSVDTCQDLPSIILLYKTDIYNMVRTNLPWYWWKCEVEGITSIAIAKPLMGNYLYNCLY
nr:glycoprotein [Chuviridae sp.]